MIRKTLLFRCAALVCAVLTLGSFTVGAVSPENVANPASQTVAAAAVPSGLSSFSGETVEEAEDAAMSLVTYHHQTGETTYWTYTPSPVSAQMQSAGGTRISPAYTPDGLQDSGTGATRALIDDWNSVNVQASPYSYVVHLSTWFDQNGDNIAQSSEYSYGTGYMVGPDVMLTAGHCMYDYDNGIYNKSVSVYIKKDESGSAATFHPINTIYSTMYTDHGNKEYDWAIVILDDNVAAQTGYFGIGTTQNSMNGRSVSISGYSYIEDSGYRQKMCSGSITGSSDRRIEYNIETRPGHSGSPVYTASDKIAWGIHTHGDGFLADPSGIRFTAGLYEIICQKIDEGRARYNY